jgi:hypothetical protein
MLSSFRTLTLWVRISLEARVYICVLSGYQLPCYVSSSRRADSPSKESYQQSVRFITWYVNPLSDNISNTHTTNNIAAVFSLCLCSSRMRNYITQQRLEIMWDVFCKSNQSANGMVGYRSRDVFSVGSCPCRVYMWAEFLNWIVSGRSIAVRWSTASKQ